MRQLKRNLSWRAANRTRGFGGDVVLEFDVLFMTLILPGMVCRIHLFLEQERVYRHYRLAAR